MFLKRLCWTHIALVKVNFAGELAADLEEGACGPVAKPVQHAAVKQSRWRRRAVFQPVFRWIHSEYHVQVVHDLQVQGQTYLLLINHTHLLSEPFVELLRRIQHMAGASGALFALCHQRRLLVALEQAGHLNKATTHFKYIVSNAVA